MQPPPAAPTPSPPDGGPRPAEAVGPPPKAWRAATASSAYAAQEQRIRAVRRRHPADAAAVAERDLAGLSGAFQRVYSEAFEARAAREEAEWMAECRATALQVTYHPTLRDPVSGERLRGCAHYARNCKLKAPCCGVFVSCRRCHDEDPRVRHALVRADVRAVLCTVCLREQPAARRCIACGVEFGRYFCASCKLYDNTPDKPIFHCVRCKLCRLGPDAVHCGRCDTCIPRAHFAAHVCCPRAVDAGCPVCYDDLRACPEPVLFMRCGHGIHRRCFEGYTAAGKYVCPLCHKSLLRDPACLNRFLDARLQHRPPPPHLRDRLSYIHCNDCEQKATVPAHDLLHKCPNPACASYNTHVVRTLHKSDGCRPAPAPAPAPQDTCGPPLKTGPPHDADFRTAPPAPDSDPETALVPRSASGVDERIW